MLRFLATREALEVSGRDVVVLAVALACFLLAIYLSYVGVRATLKPTRHELVEPPNWQGALIGGGLGAGLALLGALAVWAGADTPPNQVHSVRTIAGAHAWAVDVATSSMVLLGIAFIVLGVPRAIATWFRQRGQGGE